MNSPRRSEFVCEHGDLFMYCSTCSDVQRAMEEYMILPEADNIAEEYLYDYYLDLDERLLREEEIS